MKQNSQTTTPHAYSVEQEITKIFKIISANLKDGLVAERSKPSKGSSFCKGFVNIYEASELKSKNPCNTAPVESYAFYTDGRQPARISSVAIYGKKAFIRCLLLNLKGHLFGRKIISATVEQGRRPFVDVKLAA